MGNGRVTSAERQHKGFRAAVRGKFLEQHADLAVCALWRLAAVAFGSSGCWLWLLTMHRSRALNEWTPAADGGQSQNTKAGQAGLPRFNGGSVWTIVPTCPKTWWAQGSLGRL